MLFDPAGIFWRVNSEMMMTLAGSRAVLLELAHPLIAAGVARHSDFRRNRFGRLSRTLRLMIYCCFGDPAEVQRELRHMACRHRPVMGRLSQAAGPFPAGTEYDAADPRLRLWVWATLIDSTLVAYERLMRPLTGEEKASYYGDARKLARLFGVPCELIPADYERFRAYFDGMIASDELTVSNAAREQARRLFEGPVIGRAVRAGSALGLSLLPARIRDEFALEWGPGGERQARRLVRLCQFGRAILPDFLCLWPQARRLSSRA